MIDTGQTPKPTPPLDTPAPAPFDSHGGIRKEGNVEETGRGTEEEIGRVPSGVHRGKGDGLSISSYSSPPTKASVETQESARVETPPDTEQSSHGAHEDVITKDIERGIVSRFDLVRSPAAQGSPREEKIESDIEPLAEDVSPRAEEGQKRYTYCWDTSGILPVRQIALDIGEEYSCQEGDPGESGSTRDCDQSHNAIINHSGAAAGFQAGLDVVRVSELSDVCAICLGKYSAGDRVHVLPCLHIFHEQARNRNGNGFTQIRFTLPLQKIIVQVHASRVANSFEYIYQVIFWHLLLFSHPSARTRLTVVPGSVWTCGSLLIPRALTARVTSTSCRGSARSARGGTTPVASSAACSSL